MGIERARLNACILLCLLFVRAAQSEDAYSYELGKDDVPLFTQVISWDAIEYASAYTMEIENDSGLNILTDTAETVSRTLHLGAGRYRYRITVHNLLGKPEITGEWIDLVIRKAEQPEITSVSPRVLYLDTSGYSFAVYGKNIFIDSSVSLIDVNTGSELFGATVERVADDGALDVVLQKDSVDTGTYRVRVTNPGGLFSEDTSIFKIMQVKRSWEFSVTAGWCSWIPLYDAWYTGRWNKGFYAPGVAIRFYSSFPWAEKISFGFRTTGAFHFFDSAVDDMVLKSDCRRIEEAVFAKYRITPSLVVLGGIGCGLMLTYVEVVHETGSLMETATIDPSVCAFIELDYLFGKNWFAGAGADFTNVFYSGHMIGILAPDLFVGWQF